MLDVFLPRVRFREIPPRFVRFVPRVLQRHMSIGAISCRLVLRHNQRVLMQDLLQRQMFIRPVPSWQLQWDHQWLHVCSGTRLQTWTIPRGIRADRSKLLFAMLQRQLRNRPIQDGLM